MNAAAQTTSASLPPPRTPEWRIDATFEDKGISGAKGGERHTGFVWLHRAVPGCEIYAVIAWSVDRLLQDPVGFWGPCTVGCELYLCASPKAPSQASRT